MRYLWKKATEKYSPGAPRHWGCINTHCSHLKHFFKQKLRPKYALKCFIFEESWKNRLCPQPPLVSGGWGHRPQTPRVITLTQLNVLLLSTAQISRLR